MMLLDGQGRDGIRVDTCCSWVMRAVGPLGQNSECLERLGRKTSRGLPIRCGAAFMVLANCHLGNRHKR